MEVKTPYDRKVETGDVTDDFTDFFHRRLTMMMKIVGNGICLSGIKLEGR